MKISEAINLANDLTGQTLNTTQAVDWLSEYDGKLAIEFYRAETFTPYDPADLTTELLVPYPWDGVYLHHLEAMVYFTNGEYDRQANAAKMAENNLDEFKKYMQRTQSAPCKPGFPIEG